MILKTDSLLLTELIQHYREMFEGSGGGNTINAVAELAPGLLFVEIVCISRKRRKITPFTPEIYYDDREWRIKPEHLAPGRVEEQPVSVGGHLAQMWCDQTNTNMVGPLILNKIDQADAMLIQRARELMEPIGGAVWHDTPADLTAIMRGLGLEDPRSL